MFTDKWRVQYSGPGRGNRQAFANQLDRFLHKYVRARE